MEGTRVYPFGSPGSRMNVRKISSRSFTVSAKDENLT